MRIAIVSSPRSGNTWIRSVVGSALGLEQIAVHNYLDIGELPENCIVQIHWYREPNFQRYLNENGFSVVVVSRHPIDVLLSVLHFIRKEPLTSRWLEGNADIPDGLRDHPPSSAAFVEYATSWGAENLLAVTYQWWHEPRAIRIRYEDLCADPAGSFRSVLARLGSTAAPEAALERFSLKHFRELPNRHGWQATPGLWRSLVAPADAWRIYRRHRRTFQVLGYDVAPSLLTRRRALENWERLKA